VSGSSIFLNPSSESESEGPHNITAPDHSPTLTICRGNGSAVGTSRKVGKLKDKNHWKTLRDFVDERAIEDALETIESERNKLDVRQQPFCFINLDSIEHITAG
jgi:autophagy-related protein 17